MTETQMSWSWVTEHGAVATGPPDELAVLGAKTSRTADVEKKWRQLVDDAGGVEAFLDLNFGDYGHGSIGTMAQGLFLHVRKVGWPFAWYLEDHPLFVGQETSTRAVDLTREGYARTAPDDKRLRRLHDEMLEAFAEEKAKLASEGGYRYDTIRYLLPGTISTAVTYVANVRVGMRHLYQMRHSLPETFQEPVNDLIAGMHALAPRASKNARYNPVPSMSTWSWKTVHRTGPDLTNDDLENVEVAVTPITRRVSVEDLPPRDPGRLTYLDPLWSRHRRFDLKIVCTVAAARDWHRHRPAMPWTVRVLTGDWRDPKLQIRTPASFDEGRAGTFCDLATEVFYDLRTPIQERLHALPFGALVELTCEVDMRNLLYMLELRYRSGGANAEYKAQALAGLWQLNAHLSPEEREAALPLAAVSDEDKERADSAFSTWGRG